MSNKALSKRAEILFKILVERYIREGQPIGSKTLTEDAGLPVSPATVRNVLAELEAQGYLSSPHTSAGRIPTARGYRLFVDSLLMVQPLANKEVAKVKKQLDPSLDNPRLLAKASSLLSNITSLTGLVTIPKQRHLSLRHVEFLPLSGNQILVVLVLNGREVQNRIITTQRVYSQSELQQAANYLNCHFAGKELRDLKRCLQKKMEEDKREINQLLQAAIDMPLSHEDFMLSGQAHLLNFADTDISQMAKLRELFEAFTQKHSILHLLDQCLQANGLQIYIGEESGYGPLADYSVVTAPYSVGEKIVGALAVIGPTRMAYDRIIPIVDITAKLLSSALNQIE